MIAYLWPHDLVERNRSRYQRLVYLSKNRKVVLFKRKEKRLSNELERTVSEIKHPPIDHENRYVSYIIYYIYCVLTVGYLGLSNRINIVHTFPGPTLQIGFLWSSILGLTWVADILDDPSVELESLDGYRPLGKYATYWIHVQLTHHTLPHADTIVAVGTDVNSGLAAHVRSKYKIDKKKILPIPNGADVKRTKREKKTHSDKFTIFYVGSMKKARGIDSLIRSVGSLTDDYDDIRLQLLGPTRRTEDRVAIRQLLQSEGIEDVTQFPDKRVPHQKVLNQMARADVCVLPLSGKLENYKFSYPIKLFEYLSMGKPIVASNQPGVSEIVEDNTHALLTTPGNVDEFTENLRILYQNPNLRSRLGDRAKERAEDFDWANIGEQLLDGYPSVS